MYARLPIVLVTEARGHHNAVLRELARVIFENKCSPVQGPAAGQSHYGNSIADTSAELRLGPA